MELSGAARLAGRRLKGSDEARAIGVVGGRSSVPTDRRVDGDASTDDANRTSPLVFRCL
jgi:hypothetical protein